MENEFENDDVVTTDNENLNVEVDKALETALIQKNKFREKAEEKDAKIQELTAALEAAQQAPTDIAKRLDRVELIAQGFGSDDIEVIEKVAAEIGISPIEASQRPFVQAEIAHLKQTKDNAAAMAEPDGAGAPSVRDVDYYIKEGIMPDDPEMADKVDAELIRRS